MSKTAVGQVPSENHYGNTAAEAQRAALQFSSEEQLEAAIRAASDRMCEAQDREGKLLHWREMCRLIDLRTPARRRFMGRVRWL